MSNLLMLGFILLVVLLAISGLLHGLAFVLRLIHKCMSVFFPVIAFRAIKNSPVLRKLGHDEYRLLKPYLALLAQNSRRSSQQKLLNYDVHGLLPSEIEKVEISFPPIVKYRFMGKIPVIFPYGLDRYLKETNELHAVLTKNAIIVIYVNNVSLLTAKKLVEQTPQYADLQWNFGNKGAFHSEKRTIIGGLNENGVTILSQRNMTKTEQILSSKLKSSLISAGAFSVSVFLLMFGIFNPTKFSLLLILLTLVMLVISAIFYFRKYPKFITAVNRIKGRITGHDPQTHRITLNHTTQFSYPPHWQLEIAKKMAQAVDIEADVLVSSYEIIAIDETLSLNNENSAINNRHPLLQNAIFTGTGALFCTCLFAFMPFHQTSLIYTYNQLFGDKSIINITDNNQLNNKKLQRGDWIDLHGTAECKESMLESCSTLLINRQLNPQLDTSQIQLPDWIDLLLKHPL